jgi:hypothetical protein
MAPWQDSAVLDMLGPQMSTAMAAGKLASAPLVLRESLVFPYLSGLEFVAHFRRHHSWRRIDAIYKKPPLSTEHILHPAKYEAYERPTRVTVAPVSALAGYTMIYDNVNGEVGMGVILRQHVTGSAASEEATRKKADRAAAGWGGDRIAVYTPAGHDGGLAGTVGISYSVWDETADALEFFDMLSDAMPSLSGGKAVKTEDAHVEYHDAAGAVYAAQRKGDAVVVVLGASKERAPGILGQVWKRWRVQRR